MVLTETDSNDNVAEAIVVHLAGKISQAIKTMTNRFCVMAANPVIEKGIGFGGMVVIVPFSGTAQGYCIMAMDEKIAASLLEAHSSSMALENIQNSRDEYIGLCQEILNVAVGDTMVDLQQRMGDLTYFPSFVVFGAIVFPLLQNARVHLSTTTGTILCAFLIDMAQQKLANKLAEVAEELSKKTLEAFTDGLTMVYTRMYFEQRFRQELEAVLGDVAPIGVIMVDVDSFREVNDLFGQAYGDEVLRSVACALQASINTTDFIGRFGGDEFIVALSACTAAEVGIASARIRSYVSECRPGTGGDADGLGMPVSVSIGATTVIENDTFETVIDRVAKLLQAAKSKGPNQSVSG